MNDSGDVRSINDADRRNLCIHMLVWNTFLNDARVFNEAETLARAGFSVTVLALAAPAVAADHETVGSGVRVVRFGAKHGTRQLAAKANSQGGSKITLLFRMLSRIFTLLAMLRFMRRERPNVIHAHDVNMLPLAWLGVRLTGASLVYDAHEISTHREGYRALRNWVWRLEKFLMRRANGVITTTEARAKFFARAYKVERPLVLQNRPRQQSVAKADLLRQELGLVQPWPVVIYQGGQQPGRGLSLLVEAINQVPSVYLVFVGGGTLNNKLRALVKQLALESRVFFIPTVLLPELPSYTSSADIGVQPIENTCLNHFTTDSNKLFEYVQAGIPIIASDLPEIRAVVKRHDLGLLVPPGDLRALAEAIRRLVNDVSLRNYYSERSKAAASELCWETQEQLLISLYDRLFPLKH